MPRLTISLSKSLHHRLSSLAAEGDHSLSHVINQLVLAGLEQSDKKSDSSNPVVEQHCQQLIMQMSALIKSMSSAMLKFNQDDFEKLRLASVVKYNELLN